MVGRRATRSAGDSMCEAKVGALLWGIVGPPETVFLCQHVTERKGVAKARPGGNSCWVCLTSLQ